MLIINRPAVIELITSNKTLVRRVMYFEVAVETQFELPGSSVQTEAYLRSGPRIGT